MTTEAALPPRAEDLTLVEQVALLSGQDFWRTQALPDRNVPAVLLSDGPHGMRVQAQGSDHLGLVSSQSATCFPTGVTLASTWDEDLARSVGEAVAKEASALRVGVVLGPGLNIKRHPLCGRNFEYFSEDPLLSGRMAAAVVAGIQSQGVGACIKHFAVNNQEYHRFVVDAVVDERTLREIYLRGFEYVVRSAKPWAVMAAYNSVNGTTCTENTRLLNDILRGEWGFDGIVISDWGATRDRSLGVAAGMDLEMPNSGGISDQDVVAAVREGRLPESAVATSAQRVLDLAAKAHLAERDVSLEQIREPHDLLARRVAAEGTVLLANNGLLPLAADVDIAVIGAFAEKPRFQGAGSSMVTPTSVTTALAAFQSRGIQVTYARGYDPDGTATDPDLLAQAVQVAANSDVVILLVGLPGSLESEGFDRDHLRLPLQHDELIARVCKANRQTVVALSNGAPVLMPWRDAPAAILECYLGGQASGAALVDVLVGDVEPGGRLAETFPVRQQDIGSDPFFPGLPHQVEHREGVFVGYRHHVTAGVAPAFPFGHGRGYTHFSWTNIAVDRDLLTAGHDLRVSLTVTNAGLRAGSDVVQVYLADKTKTVLRPARELGGFTKVRLAAGESRDVTVVVPGNAFAYYDSDASNWVVPSGEFEIQVAHSSEDLEQSLTISVRGDGSRPEAPAGAAPIASSDAEFAARLGGVLPTPRVDRPVTRDSTMAEIASTPGGRLVRRVVWRSMPLDEATRANSDAMRMMERTLDELPLRAAALLSRGRLTWRRVDTVIDLLNGRPLRALRRHLPSRGAKPWLGGKRQRNVDRPGSRPSA
jgi:beta-glucosidase